jgi:uroporphyrinogen III methyltransferase / synthase
VDSVSTPSRPLEGRTIVVTRPARQAAGLTELLSRSGARVIEAPTIEIEPPESWVPVDAALDELATFAWVAFTSVNGVTMLEQRLPARGITWREVGARRVAAIGPATARALEERGVRVDLVPGDFRAEALASALIECATRGDRVLLPRAARTRDVLVVELRRAGLDVVEVAAYRTRTVGDGAGTLRAALAEGRVDAVTLTSSSTARGFARLFTADERARWLGGVTIASIGPITAATAAEQGLLTGVMPTEYTIPALARALDDHFGAGPKARRSA